MGGTVPVPATKYGMTALSMEFVSKPQEAYRLPAAVPAVIEGALGHLAGFAGCMLLISDKESRLDLLGGGEPRGALQQGGGMGPQHCGTVSRSLLTGAVV